MLVPIENLQLQTLLRERVFVTWVDSAGMSLTLGSCLYRNKQNPEFIMAIGYDMEGYIYIHFSFVIFIRVANKKQRLEMLLVVLPNANFANAPMCLTRPNIDYPLFFDNPFLSDASVFHEVGISESDYVILIPFNLTVKGFVIMKETFAIIRTWNSTSNEMIRTLESLSNVSIFNVYIRPNDYAQEGLKELCKRLGNAGGAIHRIGMEEMYIQQRAMLVEWSKFGYQDQQDQQPPSYADNPVRPIPEVQVPRSPQIALQAERVPPNAIKGNQTPVQADGIPISQEHFSYSDIELSDNEINLDDFEWDSQSVDKDLEMDSDMELLVDLQLRDIHQKLKLKEDLAISKILESKFINWITETTTINPDVNDHKRLMTKLSTLGDYIRTSNARVFDTTRP
ncbi:hypothetical protein EAF04_000248 [Stromatinia cepivora]|nr:hypothetical protein EAF04_000248 [Stromatinia cepivora]